MKIKEFLNDKKSVIILSLFISCLLFGLLLLFSGVRQFIIEFVEKYLVRRELRDFDKWHYYLFRIAIFDIVISSIVIIIICFWEKISNNINSLRIYNYKQFKFPFLFMTGLYTLGIITIIRANFLYIDDLGRAVRGYLFHFSRHISDILATVIHTNTRLTDISPLTQIIAILFIAAASVIVCFVISDGKFSKTILLASLPIGLSPWFLECFSYKFDSPYMALSVFVSVFPFLFIKEPYNFSICSILSLLVMCMSYQASSGIYILLVIILCLKKWNERNWNNIEILKFIAISFIAYVIAMVSFIYTFIPLIDAYHDITVFPVQHLITGVINNFSSYIKIINSDLSSIWRGLLIISCIMFHVRTVVFSKQNRIAAFFVSSLAIALMCVLSYGSYLILQMPGFDPRMIYSFGIFIAIVGVYTATSKRRLLAMPALVLCWCFFVFSFSYGNALADQKRWNDFRTEILLEDLSKLYSDRNEIMIIRTEGSIGHAPTIHNIASRNPVVKRLVPVNLGGDWYWANFYITRYFNFNLQYDTTIDGNKLETLLDTRYHIIRGNDREIYVVFK